MIASPDAARPSTSAAANADHDWLTAAHHALRRASSAHLPELLADLAERLTAAGGIVHRAADAADACRIVCNLLDAAGVHEVVTARSEITRLIGLDAALSAAGITAHRTDLDVASAWADDVPNDPPTTDPTLWRSELRKRFLSATAAVVGAATGVAATGTIGVVGTVGDARMCLALPRTLVTVLRAEDIVPRIEDLEVLLRLLAESPTGPRAAFPTSLWTGIHRGDGPTAVHVVVVSIPDDDPEVVGHVGAAVDADGSGHAGHAAGVLVTVGEGPTTVTVSLDEPVANGSDPTADDTDVVERFAARMAANGADVHRTTPDMLPGLLAELIRVDERLVVPTGLDPDWLRDLLDRMQVTADVARLAPFELDTYAVSLTGAARAIADTGTVVLDGSHAQGRRMLTLVPDRHVCVVLADRIVGSVAQALSLLDVARPITLLSGPSAVSDEEREATPGVHGPRTLVTVIVEPRPAAGDADVGGEAQT